MVAECQNVCRKILVNHPANKLMAPAQADESLLAPAARAQPFDVFNPNMALRERGGMPSLCDFVQQTQYFNYVEVT
jgi:hypothetical protein